MIKFTGLRPKTFAYLINDGSRNKKSKGTKECVIIRKLKFENYKNCLEATGIKNKINHLEKNEIHIDNIKKLHNNS